MINCPDCGKEFSGDSAVCVDCSEPVSSGGAEVSGHDLKTSDDSEFVVLRAYPSRIHAGMVGEALAGAGIGWLIKSNEMFGSGTGLGTMAPTRVEVWVIAGQYEAAQEIADGTLDPV